MESVSLQKKKKRGWEGEELELEHQREQMMMTMMHPSMGQKKGEEGGVVVNSSTASTSAAVDLNQFRNTEVGRGFQAKHVIRQRTATTSLPTNKVMLPTKSTMGNTRMVMMTDDNNNNNNNNNISILSKSHRDNDYTSNRSKVPISSPHLTKEALLRNEGLRQFRKEIETILSSSR
jgi:hypothetical protein